MPSISSQTFELLIFIGDDGYLMVIASTFVFVMTSYSHTSSLLIMFKGTVVVLGKVFLTRVFICLLCTNNYNLYACVPMKQVSIDVEEYHSNACNTCTVLFVS